MVLCCLLNRGDSLLCDEYTYSHLVEAMVGPKGYVAIPVPMDDYGMTPEALEKVIHALMCRMPELQAATSLLVGCFVKSCEEPLDCRLLVLAWLGTLQFHLFVSIWWRLDAMDWSA